MQATTATETVPKALTPAARQLGAVEARRMLRHPAYPIAFLFVAAFAADGARPVVRLATLGTQTPTGTVTDRDAVLPW